MHDSPIDVGRVSIEISTKNPLALYKAFLISDCRCTMGIFPLFSPPTAAAASSCSSWPCGCSQLPRPEKENRRRDGDSSRLPRIRFLYLWHKEYTLPWWHDLLICFALYKCLHILTCKGCSGITSLQCRPLHLLLSLTPMCLKSKRGSEIKGVLMHLPVVEMGKSPICVHSIYY